jgi:double zinc ribbon protein
MPVLALFGITNHGLNTAVQLVILFLIVIWLALIYYTFSDARRRVEDKMLVGCATLASLFPYAGTLVYMIVRPPEFLEDVREREMEMQAAEARLHQFEYLLCPHCDHEVEKDFLRCPSCMQKLKDACANCAKPLHPDWRLCPYCETEVGARTPTRARRRRRTTSEEAVASVAPPTVASADANADAIPSPSDGPDEDAAGAPRRRRRGRSTTSEEPVGSEASPDS